jgi:hypothetical protein
MEITRKGQTFEINADGFPTERGKIVPGRVTQLYTEYLKESAKDSNVPITHYANQAQRTHAKNLQQRKR